MGKGVGGVTNTAGNAGEPFRPSTFLRPGLTSNGRIILLSPFFFIFSQAHSTELHCHKNASAVVSMTLLVPRKMIMIADKERTRSRRPRQCPRRYSQGHDWDFGRRDKGCWQRGQRYYRWRRGHCALCYWGGETRCSESIRLERMMGFRYVLCRFGDRYDGRKYIDAVAQFFQMI